MRAPMTLPTAMLAAAFAALTAGGARAQDAGTVGRAPAANPSTAQPRTLDAEGNPPPVMPGLTEDPSLSVPTGLPSSAQPAMQSDPGTGKPR